MKLNKHFTKKMPLPKINEFAKLASSLKDKVKCRYIHSYVFFILPLYILCTNDLDRYTCIFQDTKVEPKTQGKPGIPKFLKKSGKGSLDGSEKDVPNTSVPASKLNSPHALLSKLKSQVLLNQKAKLKLHHDLIREKVTNMN